MRKIKNALILAGGDSTRFWPLEEKSLYQFLGKPLLLYQVEQLAQYTEKITVVASATNVASITRLLRNSPGSSRYLVVAQKDPDGQAGAVLSAKNLLDGEVVIVNANDLVDFSMLEKIANRNDVKDRLVLFGKKISQYFPGGYFKFSQAGDVREVVEKPGEGNEPSNITKLVVDYFSDIKLLLDALEEAKTDKDNRYEVALNSLLSSGMARDYFVYDGYWQSLKYPWHVLSMMGLFLSMIKKKKISAKATISNKALISGDVIIEDGVRIGDFVKIVGPSYIGENSVVGDYTLVRESHIGADCLIGSYSEVARSHVGNNVFLHRNYVGDSVLADGSLMGAQAVTANFRFDGKSVASSVGQTKVDSNLHKFGAIVGRNSKIGVNSTILPGIKIGRNTFIAPSHSIAEDVSDDSFVRKGVFKNKQ
ncbi:sugar phosphate nucleotidyltransferase [Patescibacteria group bacterium]|nr:sugar phosphate nucleotidyltransferase [Patescibacteria group bacterium]